MIARSTTCSNRSQKTGSLVVGSRRDQGVRRRSQARPFHRDPSSLPRRAPTAGPGKECAIRGKPPLRTPGVHDTVSPIPDGGTFDCGHFRRRFGRQTSRLCDFHIRMKPSYACGPRAGRPMGHRRAHSNKLAIYGRLRMARFSVNGQSHNIDVDPSTPLLWVLREQVGLTGTKYGCYCPMRCLHRSRRRSGHAIVLGAGEHG